MLYLNSKSKFKGFSLLELLLVMGSLAAIVAIGFWIYSLAAERQRINTAQKQLASIQKGMNDIYGFSDYRFIESLIKSIENRVG
ncbi:hypothetical protein MLG99_022215 [Escherichia coli]|uniref:type II secretion system protein n=1 Tax=Klebsiella pneumoniae TaxID=573 RepID=UPI0034E5F125|nr:hypothetical protein [Escherichia coli]